MKIYKRKLSGISKSYLLNILIAMVIFFVASMLIGVLYALVLTLFIYSYLIFRTYTFDKVYFEIDGRTLKKMRGKKEIIILDLKNQKIKKVEGRNIFGLQKKSILIGNTIIDCSELDKTTFNDMFTNLPK